MERRTMIKSNGTKKTKIIHQEINALKAYTKNCRKHPEHQIQILASSLKRFGFLGVILVDDNNEVIAGHARLLAAERAGIKRVPTIKIKHLTEAETKAFRIADNKIALQSDWDFDLLKSEIQDLEKLSFDIELTAFPTSELDSLLIDTTYPDLIKKVDPFDEFERGKVRPPIAKKGDVWKLGKHLLYCGDATNCSSYDAVLKGKAADMAFTDPPYNVPVNGHVRTDGKHTEFIQGSGEMSDKEFIEFLRMFLQNLHDYSKDGSIHYVCMDWRHTVHLHRASRKNFGVPKQVCIWNKTNAGQGSFYRSKYETIHVYKKGNAKHTNNFKLGETGRYRTNVWDYAGVNTMKKGRREELEMHPTVKPTALVADAIRDCSKRGDIILDPFCGSGTTIMAAQRTGRIARCIELDPQYVDVALDRWFRATGLHPENLTTGKIYKPAQRQKD
jgi:DNA modification methylase